MAYSQKTGLFYVPSNEWGMDIWNEPITYKKGAAYLGAGFNIKPLYEDHIGVLRAIDPATGEIKFEVNNRAPLWGGVLTTGGGLVFYGTPEGYLQAVDDTTGEILWKYNTGSGVVGSPITWEQDGEQYVAVDLGLGRRRAALGRRRRQGRQELQPGRLGLGLQAGRLTRRAERARTGAASAAPFSLATGLLRPGSAYPGGTGSRGGRLRCCKVLVADDHPLFREAVVLSDPAS